MKLSLYEQATLARKTILSIKLSTDSQPMVTRNDLAKFNRDLLRLMTVKRHLKNLRLVLVEVEPEKQV